MAACLEPGSLLLLRTSPPFYHLRLTGRDFLCVPSPVRLGTTEAGSRAATESDPGKSKLFHFEILLTLL